MRKKVIIASLFSLGCGCLLLVYYTGLRKSGAPTPPTAPATGAAESSMVYGWRGDGSGRFPTATPCIVWGGDEKKNVLWTAANVGRSYASPVIAGDVVLVAAEPDKLVCVSRKDGKVLWTRENGVASLPKNLKSAVKEDAHATEGGFATPTPVTDSRHVFVLYGTGVIACYDREGKRKWVRVLEAEIAPAQAGHCASPLLVDGRLIVVFGGLVALDPSAGTTLWENKTAAETCGTPAVAKIGEMTVLVTAAGDCVSVKDGKTLATGLVDKPYDYPSPIVQDGVAFFGGKTTVAVRLPTRPGDDFDTKPLWSTNLEGEVFASAVWHDGLIYVVDGGATLYALDAKDGQLIYKQTLDIPTGGASGGIFGSIAVAGGNIILGNCAGNLVVLAPGRQFTLLQVNNLDGGEGSSPAFAGRQMFLRVNEALICIGQE